MTIKYLNKKDYVSMPWKNGMGVTKEIAVGAHSPKRQDSAFLWRISIAGVTEDGPFSHFPNIDRHLMLLEGNGIALDGGEHGIGVLFEPLQVYSFSGDINLNGGLSNGPIVDLNVMVDRRFAKGDLSGVAVVGTERVSFNSDYNFIHVVDGHEAVMIDLDGEYIELAGGDCLWVEGDSRSATITRMTMGALPPRVALISITINK